MNQIMNQTMNQTLNTTFEITGFEYIKNLIAEYANTDEAKQRAAQLQPMLKESELRKSLRDTTQARQMLDEIGAPPIPRMERIKEYIDRAVMGELLLAEEMEAVGIFLVAVKRMKSYLEKGREKQIGLAFYSDNLQFPEALYEEIERSIRDGRVDDYASGTLRDIRRNLQLLKDKINDKAEKTLQSNKAYLADSFLVRRNNRLCIPVKKEYRNKIAGSVIDKSSTGATFFIEPEAVARLQEEYELLLMDEDTEVRRILYVLMEQISDAETVIREDIRVLAELDFVFAKGKLSADLSAVEPVINTENHMRLVNARNPLLKAEECVPLNFTIGGEIRGVIITGPNTGGKTVAIKTAALMNLMACAGLHVPCDQAEIPMRSQVLCDIGDGQNISDNLSTFSAHIKNVLDILKVVNRESMVVLDELGSGTDPAEGMGIAIAVLEELRKSQCLFLVTTHYPEVKEYANRYPEIMNARMAFDRDSLRPLYMLEIGKAGDSCALYIAKRLGVPASMLQVAAKEAYVEVSEELMTELELTGQSIGLQKESAPKVVKVQAVKKEAVHGEGFARGDSVEVMPDGKIGIVVRPADLQGNVLVQIAKEKSEISHKRLKLKVAASQLYPEDYDFSIIFDTVEQRKAHHQMERKYVAGKQIELT